MIIHSHSVQTLLAGNIMWEIVHRQVSLGQYQEEKIESGRVIATSFWKLDVDMVTEKTLFRNPKIDIISCPYWKLQNRHTTKSISFKTILAFLMNLTAMVTLFSP